MGWSDCGTDSQGRPIGYSHEGTCGHPGCEEKIERSLSYVCGDMHGEDEISCERYFCDGHKRNWAQRGKDDTVSVCDECAEALKKSGDWTED